MSGAPRATRSCAATPWRSNAGTCSIRRSRIPIDRLALSLESIPAGTPKDIIGRLNATVDKFLKTEDGIARLRKLGAEPAGGSPEDMQAYVLAETEKWGKVAKFAGIKAE